MANVIDETENAVILFVLVAIVLFFFWALGGLDLLKGLANGDSGVLQSLKNASNGFPSGADPGTIPAFQYFQGFVESLRNLTDLNHTLGIEPPPDPGSATVEEQQTALDNYQLPTPNQAVQWETKAPVVLQQWIDNVAYNPANLPMF